MPCGDFYEGHVNSPVQNNGIGYHACFALLRRRPGSLDQAQAKKLWSLIYVKQEVMWDDELRVNELTLKRD